MGLSGSIGRRTIEWNKDLKRYNVTEVDTIEDFNGLVHKERS